jgi:hypothetical protein
LILGDILPEPLKVMAGFGLTGQRDAEKVFFNKLLMHRTPSWVKIKFSGV